MINFNKAISSFKNPPPTSSRFNIFKFLSIFALVIMLGISGVKGQIYSHDFGIVDILTKPYNVAPGTFATNLSTSSWTTSASGWSGLAGSSGESLSLSNSSATPTYTLTFNVAAGFQVAITHFNFWRVRSSSGAQNWAMTINSTSVGSGTVPTTGAALGSTAVSTSISGLTGTVTIVLTMSGASGSGTFRLDDFTLTGSVTSTASSSSNIILNSSFTHPTNIDYTAYQTASTLTTGNSIEVGQFDIQDGGGSADADALATTLTACSLTVVNSANIRALALFDGSTNVGEITTVGSTAAFSGLTLAAADDGSKTFSVRATFKSTVTDNQQISFTVASATASGSGSSFAASNAGAAATSTTGDNNRIEVSSTDILFEQNPTTVSQNAIMNPSPTVRALDGNANYDLDNTSNVALTISTGSTSFDGAATTTVAMVAGVATFSNLIFATAATTNNLTATQGSYTDISSAFDVTASAPEINVKQGVNSLVSGVGSHAAVSIVSGNSGSAITFTIENIGSANLTYSSITNSNTTDFTLDLTSTSSPIAASSSSTFTVTFNPTTAGAKSTTITINNNDADEGTYTFTVAGTGTVSAASDIISNSGYSYGSNIDYASFQTASTLTTGNSVGVNGLIIQDGAGAADADNLGTTLTAISFTTGGSTAIRTAALFDGSTNVSEVAVNGATTISFSGLTLSTADASTKNFELRVTYQATVTDNQQITFTVSSATASATNSTFSTANAGAAVSSTTSDINRLEVTATLLAFVQQVSNVSVNSAMTSAPTVSANDGNGNRDLDYITDMTATTTATFAGGSTNIITPSAGLGTFSNLQFSTAALARTIDIGSGSLTNTGNSSTFNIFDAQPTVQASAINFTNVAMNSMTINWTNGDGANRIVVVKASGAPGTPSDGQTYVANTIFGSGSTFGTSEYVVYIGSSNTVNITGLTASTTYSVKVFEYNGSGGTENYITTSNNTSQTTTALTYYSNGSGDPAVFANWNTLRNGTGSSPTNFTSGESFVIESGDVMTTTTTWSISGINSKLQIESGGTLTANHAITLAAATTFQIDNGGIYIHNNTGIPSSTIFTGTESFGASSNIRIDNWTSNSTVITTGVTLPFGNLEINYTSNTANWQNSLNGTINLTGGNFTVTSVGSGSFRFAAAGAPTITVAGNYIQSAGIVNLASTSGSSVTTLNVGGNFAVNGGTFTSTSTGSKVVFNKSGSQSFTNAGTISVVNFEVGASSILDLGTSVLSGGSFTIPSGSTLKTAHALGISGAITATTKTFSSAANYEFNGAATGTFTTTPTASTVNNLTINNSAGVALSQNLAVAGTLTQTSGKFSIGANTLTLNGAYSGDATNSLTGGSTSNLTTNGTTGILYFNQTTQGTTNLLNNLTVSAGSTTLGNALNITGAVDAVGTITSGGNLTIKSSSATVNGRVAGSNISGNINVERFIPSQSTRRYRFLSSPVSTNVADWRGEIFITGGGASSEFSSVGTNNIKSNGLDWTLSGAASMYGYTENLNSGGLNTRWEAITSGSNSLTAGKGYRVFIRGDRSNAGVLDNSVTTQAAVTIVSTGTINSGTITLPATYNGGTANDGWNLVGNPYPSTIDWNAASGWTKTNVSGTIWIYKPSTNSYGNWDGATATNGVTQYISSGQAFFVRTTGTPTFSCTEAVKTATAGAGIFKTDPENTLRISLAKDAANSDETVIRFMEGKQNEFSDNDDVRKFINSEVNVSSNFGLDQYAAVNYLDPKNLTNKVVKISAWVDVNGNYKLNFSGVNSFNTTPYVMLRDKYLNKLVDLRTNNTYQFDITNDSKSKDDNRFEVIFSDKSSGLNESNAIINTNLSIYPNPATDVLNISLSNGTTIETVTIYNVSGKLVNNTKLNGNQLDISQLNNGVYMLEVLTANGIYKTKFVK